MIRPPAHQTNLNALYDFLEATYNTLQLDIRNTLNGFQPLTSLSSSMRPFTPYPELFTGLKNAQIKNELITEFRYLQTLGARTLIDTVLQSIAKNAYKILEYPPMSFILNDEASHLNDPKKLMAQTVGIIVLLRHDLPHTDLTAIQTILDIIVPPHITLVVTKNTGA